MVVEISRAVVLEILHRGDLANVSSGVGLGSKDTLNDPRVVMLLAQVKGPSNEADFLDGRELHVSSMHGGRPHECIHDLVIVQDLSVIIALLEARPKEGFQLGKAPELDHVLT